MDILIFIGFFILLIATKPIIYNMIKRKRNIEAIIVIVGLIFIKPFALIWYSRFLFDYNLTYWIAFGTIIVIDVFTYEYKPTED